MMKKHIGCLLLLAVALPIYSTAAENNDHADSQPECHQIETRHPGEAMMNCQYKKLTLLQAYQSFKKESAGQGGEFLTSDLSNLQKANYQEKKGPGKVYYSRKSAKELVIDMQVVNGVGEDDQLTFSENTQGTMMTLHVKQS